jgi:hypothetical protein
MFDIGFWEFALIGVNKGHILFNALCAHTYLGQAIDQHRV